ncbi:hypothetical protein FRX31_011839 [Thalictrum thalictroides]|uniref:RNase H type-1 domain-containing protein n=1 Tax=Thalictrum thalictroides TaxID=46969 RepID=A0A7J6WQ29_THATH|nr:hypothetical protein FRX31_011839 [Thalictrum thalictroides]
MTSIIAAAIQKREVRQKVHQFLIGRHPNFEAVRTQVRNTSPLPTLGEAYAVIEKHETGAGGVLRSSDGSFIFGFASPIPHATNYAAEFLSLLLGLKVCVAMNFSHIMVETDTQLLFNAIHHKNFSIHWTLIDITKEIFEQINQLQDFCISWNYREANSCADALACLASTTAANNS